MALPLAAPGMQSGIMQTPRVTIPGFPWDSVLDAGSTNHSQSPSRLVPALPNQHPKAQRGLWESGPAESGQRGWSDSIDRNLIPNWLRRGTPARPGFEPPGRTNPPVPAGFWEAGSMHPCRASWSHTGFCCIPFSCRGLRASRKDPSPVAQPRIPSHLPSSCSQGQSPLCDLQPPPAAFPGFPWSFPGTLVMPGGPELSSLFPQPGRPCGARHHPNTASGMAESSARRIYSQNYPQKDKELWEAEVYKHLNLDQVALWSRDEVAGGQGICGIPCGHPPWLVSLHPQHST